jgi:hypothetical protein
MKQAIMVVVCLGLALGNTSCAVPVALGAAAVGAGAGAQAGWWFGKSSKQASEAKDKTDKKEATHAGSESR